MKTRLRLRRRKRVDSERNLQAGHAASNQSVIQRRPGHNAVRQASLAARLSGQRNGRLAGPMAPGQVVQRDIKCPDRRHKVEGKEIPAFTVLRGRASFYKNATDTKPEAQVPELYRIIILGEEKGRYKVRIDAGPESIAGDESRRAMGRVGYINRNEVMIPDCENPAADSKLSIPAARPISLVFFQNPERRNARDTREYQYKVGERNDFMMKKGMEMARANQSVFVDPRSGRCIDKAIPIEYRSAEDIARTIAAAAKCTDRLIARIDIVGHGFKTGLSGAGDIQDYYGLYVKEKYKHLQKNGNLSPGAMSTEQFAQEIRGTLTNGVQIRIWNCSTGKEDGFAQELSLMLHKEARLSAPEVTGFIGIGNPNHPRKSEVRTYRGGKVVRQ